MRPHTVDFRRFTAQGRVGRFGISTGPGDLHLNQWLAQVAIGYTPQGIIADQLFPIVPVAKQTDVYAVFSRQEALTTEDDSRSPGVEAKKLTRSIGSGTYYAKNYALKIPITIEDRVNSDPVFTAQLIGGRVRYVHNKLYLNWDRRISNLVNSSSNVGSSATVGSAWSGAGSPLTNLWTSIDNVRYRTGYRPNKMVFGTKSWDSFSRDSTVRNIIFGTNNGGGYPSLDQVKNLFQIDMALIGNGVYSSANEAQAETISVIYPDNVLVAYIPPTPSIEDPSFGYSFRWSAPGIANMNPELHPYDEKVKSDEIEMGYYQDERITGSEYGFLIRAVNSSQ